MVPAKLRRPSNKMGHMHTRSMTRPGSRAMRKVGFFGCNNRVVRVELKVTPEAGKRYPEVVWLMCPACRHEHDAHPLWRLYMPALDGKKDAVMV
jgi:hypothetical protein